MYSDLVPGSSSLAPNFHIQFMRNTLILSYLEGSSYIPKLWNVGTQR